MAKSETIVVRVDTELKRRLEAAARKSGGTLTSFVLDASERAAIKEEAKPVSCRWDRRVPQFFRKCCDHATSGGSQGYVRCGYVFAERLDRHPPRGVSESDLEERLLLLEGFLQEGDDDAIWNWLRANYPQCLTLIPSRRKAQFLAGVYQAFDDQKMASRISEDRIHQALQTSLYYVLDSYRTAPSPEGYRQSGHVSAMRLRELISQHAVEINTKAENGDPDAAYFFRDELDEEQQNEMLDQLDLETTFPDRQG